MLILKNFLGEDPQTPRRAAPLRGSQLSLSVMEPPPLQEISKYASGGKYNDFSEEERLAIAQAACLDGPTRAAKMFFTFKLLFNDMVGCH